MNELKITSGKWWVEDKYTIRGEGAVKDAVVSLPSNLCTIATVNSWLVNGKRNAALMAAAPEMYETLAKCLDYISRCPMTRNAELEDAINASLAKARGDKND